MNPFSYGAFDLKTFNELRPGLILWFLVDISMVCEQATRRGGFSQVTDSMWLVLLFQGLYVADGLYNEVRFTRKIPYSRADRKLSLVFSRKWCGDYFYGVINLLKCPSQDITSDGFGFMLAVGDLCWVPFVYCLQARYLVFRPAQLGPVASVAIFLCNFAGYYIFRTANGEKNDFRNGKNPKSGCCLPYSNDEELI